MIHDSIPWKKELLKISEQLVAIAQRRQPSGKLYFEFEKIIFVSAYSIRKLVEAKKLSTITREFPVSTILYTPRRKPVTHLNWHKIDELYDMENPFEKEQSLSFICNQIIHSYVFMPFTSSMTGPIKNFVFASDHQRTKKLYSVSLLEWSRVLAHVGSDYPDFMVALSGSLMKNIKDHPDFKIPNHNNNEDYMILTGRIDRD